VKHSGTTWKEDGGKEKGDGKKERKNLRNNIRKTKWEEQKRSSHFLFEINRVAHLQGIYG
jgi:hypothetical protein